MEESGTVEADAPQQSSFPPDSVPTVVPSPIPVENSNTPQPEVDIHPPSVSPDAILIPNAASAPVPSPNPSDPTRKFMALLPIILVEDAFLLLAFGYHCLVFLFQQMPATVDGFPLYLV